MRHWFAESWVDQVIIVVLLAILAGFLLSERAGFVLLLVGLLLIVAGTRVAR